ncbi:hypothetical protein V501_04427 [Pseudogymnoascus sp. VKM F-4519 (FW-2642)]|nr:hypothetical protein V501_04427 [Pseudogymnoascus sp. VKM F-4519 (FW-2642)]
MVNEQSPAKPASSSSADISEDNVMTRSRRSASAASGSTRSTLRLSQRRGNGRVDGDNISEINQLVHRSSVFEGYVLGR